MEYQRGKMFLFTKNEKKIPSNYVVGPLIKGYSVSANGSCAFYNTFFHDL